MVPNLQPEQSKDRIRPAHQPLLRAPHVHGQLGLLSALLGRGRYAKWRWARRLFTAAGIHCGSNLHPVRRRRVRRLAGPDGRVGGASPPEGRGAAGAYGAEAADEPEDEPEDGGEGGAKHVALCVIDPPKHSRHKHTEHKVREAAKVACNAADLGEGRRMIGKGQSVEAGVNR